MRVRTPHGSVRAEAGRAGHQRVPAAAAPDPQLRRPGVRLRADDRAAVGGAARGDRLEGPAGDRRLRPTSSTTTGSRPTTGSCGAATTRSTTSATASAADLDQRPETFGKLAEHFFDDLPPARGAAVQPRLGRCDRHLQPVLRLLGHRAPAAGSPTWPGTPGSGWAPPGSGRGSCSTCWPDAATSYTALEMVRSKPVPFPPEPMRWAAIELTRRSHRPGRPQRGPPQPVAAHPGPARARLRLLSRRRHCVTQVAGLPAVCGWMGRCRPVTMATVSCVLPFSRSPKDLPWPSTSRTGSVASRSAVSPSDRATCTTPRPVSVSGTVDFASAADVDDAVAAAKEAFAEWRNASLTRRTQVMFSLPRAAQRAQGGDGRADHGRARQGALRRARRGHPRPRGRRVRLRHPAPAEGRLLRERVDQGRLLLAPPAPRRRRHHLAVQLPGHGPDVVLPDRHRRGQHGRAQAQREGPVGREPAWPSCGTRPGCRPASSTSSTATRSRSTGCSSTPTSRRCRSSAPPRSPATSTRPAPAHGKRVQALGGAKNHMLVLPDADLDLAADAAVNAGFGSAGERCMAISVVVAVEPVADELIAKITERMATLRIGDGRRGCDMGPLVTAAAPRQGRVLPRRRRRAGRHPRGRRPRGRGRRRGRRLLARPDPVRPGHPGHVASTPTRSSARCCPSSG